MCIGGIANETFFQRPFVCADSHLAVCLADHVAQPPKQPMCGEPDESQYLWEPKCDVLPPADCSIDPCDKLDECEQQCKDACENDCEFHALCLDVAPFTCVDCETIDPCLYIAQCKGFCTEVDG